MNILPKPDVIFTIIVTYIITPFSRIYYGVKDFINQLRGITPSNTNKQD